MGVVFSGGFKSLTSTKVKTISNTTTISTDAIAHFRGEDATTTSWADSKGNAPTLTTAGSGNNITIENFRNGLSAPRFRADKYLTENSNFFSLNELTCIVVYKPIFTSTWNFIVGKDNYSWGSGWGIELRNNNVGGFFADNGPDSRSSTNTNTEFVTGLAASVSDGTYTTWSVGLTDSTASVTTRNGIQNKAYNADPYPFQIGGVNTSNWRFNGQVSDVIIWDRRLDRSEFDTQFVALKNKYGT